jgi:hypothetical protein
LASAALTFDASTAQLGRAFVYQVLEEAGASDPSAQLARRVDRSMRRDATLSHNLPVVFCNALHYEDDARGFAHVSKICAHQRRLGPVSPQHLPHRMRAPPSANPPRSAMNFRHDAETLGPEQTNIWESQRALPDSDSYVVLFHF